MNTGVLGGFVVGVLLLLAFVVYDRSVARRDRALRGAIRRIAGSLKLSADGMAVHLQTDDGTLLRVAGAQRVRDVLAVCEFAGVDIAQTEWPAA